MPTISTQKNQEVVRVAESAKMLVCAIGSEVYRMETTNNRKPATAAAGQEQNEKAG
jgi:hypothetical protein